jgi:hypothetical protein
MILSDFLYEAASLDDIELLEIIKLELCKF